MVELVPLQLPLWTRLQHISSRLRNDRGAHCHESCSQSGMRSCVVGAVAEMLSVKDAMLAGALMESAIALRSS